MPTTTWRTAFARIAGGPGFARMSVLAPLAATGAFAIGSLYDISAAIVAAITALISIRPTFHDSVKGSLIQVVGTLLGAGTAFVLTRAFGESWLILFAALFASYVTARLLRLGEEGAVTIAVTVVLVTGGNMDTTAVEYRLLGVVIGVMLATLLSLYTASGSPTDRALRSTVEVADRLAIMLAEIGDTLHVRASGVRVPADTIVGWLNEAQALQRKLEALWEDADDALRGTKYSPLIRQRDARQVLAQVELTQATCSSVISICRDLLVLSHDTDPLPAPLSMSLSGVLGSLADVVSEQANIARANPAGLVDLDLTGALQVTKAAVDASGHLKNLDDTMPLLIGGSILQDGRDIARTLTGSQSRAERQPESN